LASRPRRQHRSRSSTNYPYLFYHIAFDELKDKDVLEVVLGYGTIAQRMAESGAQYMGLDIADGPVAMAKHRLRLAGLRGDANQGSILDAPFEDYSFDMIVTIGCLHHRGDLQKAINECHRMLRPGGKLVVMLYYAYPYHRWIQAPGETLRYLWREVFGYRDVVQPSNQPRNGLTTITPRARPRRIRILSR
jgi:SAM-dependent methyltransferase